ncbi:MAG: formimidoylglutamate deiminase [Polymorphobacter sp.]
MHNFWFSAALLPAGWARAVRVSVDAAGLIAAIATGAPSQRGDDRHGVLLPGMGNLHSHAFQRGMAGLAEVRGESGASIGDSFWTWRDTMYRFVDRLDPDALAAIAALAYVEMLESGFTRVGEFHYLHHDIDGAAYADRGAMAAALAAAAAETGIALTLLPVFYATADFGGAPAQPAQRRFVNSLDSYARLHDASRAAVAALDDSRIGIAPHSLRAVTPEQLAALLPLANGAPIHIHVAEQTREVDACVAWSGARPVEWLLANAPVDDRWCLVHATHITPAERRAIAGSTAIVGLCPVTEANLGDGIFPAVEFVGDGGRFGIGSDSNIAIDAAEELRTLEYGQRLRHRSRNLLGGAHASTGAGLFGAALAGGAQALQGTAFEPGAPADFVTLAADHPATVGRSDDALLDALVFSGRRDLIDGVWRRGRRLVAGGRHVARDAVVARYLTVMRAVLGA